MRFKFVARLQRHQRDKHPERQEGQLVVFCETADCQYSTTKQDTMDRHKASANCPL